MRYKFWSCVLEKFEFPTEFGWFRFVLKAEFGLTQFGRLSVIASCLIGRILFIQSRTKFDSRLFSFDSRYNKK